VVPLVVAGDDLDIEAAIRTVGSRDPVCIDVLDSPRLVTRARHTAMVAEYEVAETPEARLGQCSGMTPAWERPDRGDNAAWRLKEMLGMTS
jgi:hypothetical protein